MKCIEAEKYITQWESGKEPSETAKGFSAFEEHLSSCASCNKRFGKLLLFLRRETLQAPLGVNMAFVDTVMKAIEKEKPHTAKTRFFPGTKLYPVLAAALLVAVFASGFLFRGVVNPAGTDSITVHFTYNAPEASSVVLVGSFPDWSVNESHAMKKNKDGQWELDIKLKKSGVYTYNFLVDGNTWVPDPEATEVIDDGFGGTNSLLRI